MNKIKPTDLADRIEQLIAETRKRTIMAVNTAMVYTYFEIGRMIVEDEQQGEQRAEYGTAMLKNVAKRLTKKFGKGFTFVGRQARFTFDEQHFRVDLVFYNRLLRSFVLIDLKRGTLKHQDLGQMQTYVNYYDPISPITL